MLEIKGQDEFNQLITENNNVCVDFWAPWCGPCKMLSPILNQINDEIDGVVFAKVNIDDQDNKSIVEKQKISSIPTLIQFKDGIKSDSMVGVKSKQDIITWLTK